MLIYLKRLLQSYLVAVPVSKITIYIHMVVSSTFYELLLHTVYENQYNEFTWSI